jgi:hypothetical protein
MITQLVTPGPNPVSNLYFPPEKMKSYKSDLELGVSKTRCQA